MCLEYGSPVFSLGSAPADSSVLMTAVEALLTLDENRGEGTRRAVGEGCHVVCTVTQLCRMYDNSVVIVM